jgi:hypothetical protein
MESFVSGDYFILVKCVQNVVKVIEFVSQAGTADFGGFLNLCAERFWPFFDVLVVLVEDESTLALVQVEKS